jgi:hypothetical protein
VTQKLDLMGLYHASKAVLRPKSLKKERKKATVRAKTRETILRNGGTQPRLY